MFYSKKFALLVSTFLLPQMCFAADASIQTIEDMNQYVSHFKLKLDPESGRVSASGLMPKDCVGKISLIFSQSEPGIYHIKAKKSPLSQTSQCTSTAASACTQETCVDASKDSRLLDIADRSSSLSKSGSSVQLLKSAEKIYFVFEDPSFPVGDEEGITKQDLNLSFEDADARAKRQDELDKIEADLHFIDLCERAEENLDADALAELKSMGIVDKEFLADLESQIAQNKINEIIERSAEATSPKEIAALQKEIEAFVKENPKQKAAAADALVGLVAATEALEMTEGENPVYAANKRLKSSIAMLKLARKYAPANQDIATAYFNAKERKYDNAAASNDQMFYFMQRNMVDYDYNEFSNYYNQQLARGAVSPELAAKKQSWDEKFKTPKAMPQTNALWSNGILTRPTGIGLDYTFLESLNKSYEQKGSLQQEQNNVVNSLSNNTNPIIPGSL